MPEQLLKLSPHRDLQCYFFAPSAIAAISGATDSGFKVSGRWRQQLDWAVVEWNRDNVFEHPALRYLPDGDLSGLTLTYQEERIGCMPLESNLVPLVDWSTLRIWTIDRPDDNPYQVSLWPAHATAIQGAYVAASATMTLLASPGAGNRVGLALLERSHYYTTRPGDSLAQIAQGIVTAILSNPDFTATSNGSSITVTWKPGPNYGNLLGANGNRITVYGFAQSAIMCWQTLAVSFTGGKFPTKYQVRIDFSALKSDDGTLINTAQVRKLRWTWAADLQAGSFLQTQFQVLISNWFVNGNGRQYFVAGPGSRRIEDTDTAVAYSGIWDSQSGNYSANSIHVSINPGASCRIAYSETAAHRLYLGTRALNLAGPAPLVGTTISFEVDGVSTSSIPLNWTSDILFRSMLGEMRGGAHTVVLTHSGPPSSAFFFDFLEIVYPTENLPDYSGQSQLALATDWDTYHSQSLPAERTAWLINKLGFQGRVNHYVGALWFYEIVRPGMQYASLTLTVALGPNTGSASIGLKIASKQDPLTKSITHLILPDDTPESVTAALAGLINVGTNLVWASAFRSQLTIVARSMGTAGNGIFVWLDPNSKGYSTVPSSAILNGGVDGHPYDLDTSDPLNRTLIAAADYWCTDLNAVPRLNPAAIDWHQAYFSALAGYGIDVVASFSTELMNGDPSLQAGLAQRYPDGTPVVLNTPAIQSNFSPISLAFWQQVYLDMAVLQVTAGLRPYLQAGEVQWWYFPKPGIGMPFYDQYTKQHFESQYGVPLQSIPNNSIDPNLFPNECAFLPELIGNYTAAIRGALQSQFANCRYEVLYPTDTNNTPINRLVNYPMGDWVPGKLDCLKTESFAFTSDHNLDQSAYSIGVSAAKGFSNTSRSHLIGISDASTAWMKEVDLAQAQGLESVVLFALDQYCLIGYPPPPYGKSNRTQRQG